MAFIPLHDGRPLRHITRPIVTWTMIGLNLAVYFLVQGGGFSDVDQAATLSFGLIPATLTDHALRPPEIQAIPEYLTLLTYAFFHGDLWHLAGNLVFLWVFADNVEDAFGHWRFLLFYCLCAVGGGVAYALSDPLSEAPVIGASGAVAGVIAAYFLLHPYQRIWILAFARIPLRLNALWVLGFWIVFQVVAIFGGSGSDGVAWSSHIGGLIVGGFLVLVLRRPGVPLFERSVVTPRVPRDIDRSEDRRYRPPRGPWGQ